MGMGSHLISSVHHFTFNTPSALSSSFSRTSTHTPQEVVNALSGLVVLSAECERIAAQLGMSRVPEAWQPPLGPSYPSLKPLAGWVSDLAARLDFMQKWIDRGPPPVYPLPYIFFPQVSTPPSPPGARGAHTVPVGETAPVRKADSCSPDGFAETATNCLSLSPLHQKQVQERSFALHFLLFKSMALASPHC